MRRIVRIYSCDTKTGTNERGEWTVNDLHISWTEEGANKAQETIVSVRGKIKDELLQHAILLHADVNMTVFFSVRDYNGKRYPNIIGFLPEEYMVPVPKTEE